MDKFEKEVCDAEKEKDMVSGSDLSCNEQGESEVADLSGGSGL